MMFFNVSSEMWFSNKNKKMDNVKKSKILYIIRRFTVLILNLMLGKITPRKKSCGRHVARMRKQ
jgi:hypothetical protein